MSGLDGRGALPVPAGEDGKRGPAMPPSTPRPSSPYVRNMIASVTVTAENRDTGEIVVVVGEADSRRVMQSRSWILRGRIVRRFRAEGRAYGKVSEALRDAVRKIEARPGPWRILSVSHPNSIVADLRGQRPPNDPQRWPEPRLLGTIGRLDLWRPDGR